MWGSNGLSSVPLGSSFSLQRSQSEVQAIRRKAGSALGTAGDPLHRPQTGAEPLAQTSVRFQECTGSSGLCPLC